MRTMRKTQILTLFAALVCQFFSPVAGKTYAQTQPGEFSDTADTFIDSLAVSGTDSPITEEITALLLSRAGGVLNAGLIDYDVKTITEYVREHGWWNARVCAAVDSSSSKPTILTFNIITGDPVLFGLVSHEVSGGVPDVELPASDELYGKHFTRQQLDDTIQSIMSRFSEYGHPDAKVIPSLRAHSDTVDVALYISAGQQAHIDSIALYGLTRTKDYVVRRELSSLLGRAAGPETVIEARTLIGRLGYIHIERAPYIDYDPEGAGVLAIFLTEGYQGSFDGIAGYQPSASGATGEFVGKIDLAFPNMFGTGRVSRVRWENLGSNFEDLEIHYEEPWILGFPYTVSGTFLQEERERHGYIKTVLNTSLNRHIGRLHMESGFLYEKVSADSLHSSQATGLSIGISWTSIDNPLNPASGIQYAASWSSAAKHYRFGSSRRTRLERTQFDIDHYIPVMPRQTLAVLIRYRRVDTPLEKLDPSDRYWLGGAATIRGYHERMFPAVKALWSSLEYRFLTGESSRIFAFIDIAYLVDRLQSGRIFMKKNTTLTGYGFGVRLTSRAGILGFDYGLGRGDSPGEGKLHVRVSTAF